MPRVNWSLSPEAKAVFDAFQKERGFKNQDDAINEMILEFAKTRGIIGIAIEDSKPCPDGKYHHAKVKLI